MENNFYTDYNYITNIIVMSNDISIDCWNIFSPCIQEFFDNKINTDQINNVLKEHKKMYSKKHLLKIMKTSIHDITICIKKYSCRFKKQQNTISNLEKIIFEIENYISTMFI
jgi:hypothetical protein